VTTARGAVVLYGGSFNPPHVAHVLAVTLVLSTVDVARVVVIPTFQHPFAKALAPYEDRVKMAELAMGWLPRVEVSRVEEELGGESKTLRTVERFAAEPENKGRLRLLMGSDLLLETPRWFGFDAICALAPPLVIGRVGFDVAGAPAPLVPQISSTEVRALALAKKWTELEHMVPREVVLYIKTKGLFSEAPSRP
jgi:nicotinate-nucleotide adenylyltransferase